MYAVKHNGQVLVTTDWPPMAQAAWHRATRNQVAGGIVELVKDGRCIATHRIVGGGGARWPDGQECGLRDVMKGIFQLLRDDGWDARQIAEAMTNSGLATSRARVDALRGAKGHPAELSHAEIVTLLYAVLGEYKRDDAGDGTLSPPT